MQERLFSLNNGICYLIVTHSKTTSFVKFKFIVYIECKILGAQLLLTSTSVEAEGKASNFCPLGEDFLSDVCVWREGYPHPVI